MKVEEFLKQVPYEDFYRQHLEIVKEKGHEIQAHCPFHDDKHASFLADTKTGLWTCLAGCGKGKNIIHFVEKLNQCSFLEAIRYLSKLYSIHFEIPRPEIDSSLPQKYSENLSGENEVLLFLRETKGLNSETIKKFQLGWDGKRVTIPIYDEYNKLKNIRRYSKIEKNKMISFTQTAEVEGESQKFNYGEGRIFGLPDLTKRPGEPVIICFKPGSKILTSSGFKNVEIITFGTQVFTHEGRFRKIIATEHHLNTEKIIKIRPKYSPIPLEVTENHKILAVKTKKCDFPSWHFSCHPNCARRNSASTLNCQENFEPQWIEAKDLSEGDFLAYPINKRKDLQLLESIPYKNLAFSPKFWFLVGLFLGDGTTTPIKKNSKCYTITFRVSKQRKIRLITTILKELKIKFGIYNVKNQNLYDIHFCDVQIAEFFRKTFYDENKQKCIPMWVESLPLEFQKELIYGLWATDGHYKESRNESKITNTSLDLLLSIQRILLRFKIMASVQLNRKAGVVVFSNNRKCKTKPLYQLSSRLLNELFEIGRPRKNYQPNRRMPSFFTDKYVMIPIRKIEQEKYIGLVYNLEVEEDHSLTSVLITPKNCEGEWDMMLAQQFGFLAVTGTVGAGTFKSEWASYFKNREVTIIYDVDDAGRIGAENAADVILPVAKNVHNFILPLQGTKDEKDLSDFFLKLNATADDLRELIKNSPIIKRKKKSSRQEPISLSSFSQIDKTELIDRRVTVPLEISGETSEAFHAVVKFKVKYCKMMQEGKCSKCKEPFILEPGSKEYIETCMSDDNRIIGMLREKICPFGKKPRIEILEKRTIREFFATQKIRRFLSRLNNQNTFESEDLSESESTSESEDLSERKVYYISDIPAKPKSYLATGFIKTHPKSQQICFLAEKLEPLEEEFESFKLDQESKEILKKFKKLTLKEKISFLSDQIIHLRKRERLILAILLVYFSPLQIYFGGENIRGWLNLIVLGDTATGKSTAVTRLADFTSVGESISGLTASRTGITYGLREHKQKGWQIKVGRFPANARKILLIDELQYLKSEEIRTLGKGMDEGFITVDRIADFRSFDSRTRLIALANPKDDRTMDEQMFGCEGLKKIFDKAITRRFDLAVFTSHTDIENPADLNIEFKDEEKLLFTGEMLRICIFWAWTRKSEQIEFEEKTIQKIFEETIRLSNLFGHAQDIPLVAPGDFRNKLARLSAALASFSISTDQTFEKIIVLPEHVEIISKFIEDIYSGDKCGLGEYSDIYHQKIALDDYEIIKADFEKKKEREVHTPGHSSQLEDRSELSKIEEMLYSLKIHHAIRREDLAEQLDVDKRTVSTYISLFRKHNLIESSKNGYFKKPKFVRFLRELARDNLTSLKISKIGDLATGKDLEEIRMEIGELLYKVSSSQEELKDIEKEFEIEEPNSLEKLKYNELIKIKNGLKEKLNEKF